MERNLHLALLGQLMGQGLLPPFDLNKFFQDQMGRAYDSMAEYNYDPIPEVEAYLSTYPLNDDILSDLEDLSLDGGDEIYGWIWPFWDGEDDYFSIRTFDGIEVCHNLKTMDIVGVLSLDQPVDLTGIEKLPNLSKLCFDGGLFGDLSPLTSAPELKSVTFSYSLFTPDSNKDAVFSTLRENGVTVS
jgi:hypothetical protein